MNARLDVHLLPDILIEDGSVILTEDGGGSVGGDFGDGGSG